jgi:hypothetical protein
MSAPLRAPATKERIVAALAVALGASLLLMTAFGSDDGPVDAVVVEPTTEPTVLGTVVETTTTTEPTTTTTTYPPAP